MLTHVVCFKFSDLSEAETIKSRLLELEGKVPSLKHIEAGVDVTRSERSYDLALVTRFEDQAGLEAYRVHPAHQEVLHAIREVATATVAVDYLS